MDAVRWRATRELLEGMLSLDPAQRAGRLAEIEDPLLRADVQALLGRMDQADSVLDQPAGMIAAPWVGQLDDDSGDGETDPLLGREFGRFRIEALLGTGGMGRVYRARRIGDGIEQVVALKLMLSPDPALKDRFLRERSILSGLRHPGIAQLIDIGSTPEGLPYLVMQYVEGRPLTEYCSAQGLGLADRLRLMLRVAAALSHAHRNLVIHRDLKPGNILVTSEGDPILLDFGIAKLVDAGVDGQDTRHGQHVMTPAYAAPEQFRGEPTGVATDIYQFGVLLYRLISGRLPYEASPEDPLGWARAVLERPPMTLVRALRAGTSTGDADRTEAGVSLRDVGRDLEAIVRMALAKKVGDRYSSIDALAADLRAYLVGMPVMARRGGRLYEAGRFMRRHVVAMAVTVLAAIGLLTLTGYALHQSREARAEAERSRAAVELMNEIFKAAEPSGGTAAAGGLGDLLERAAAEMQPRLEAHPDLRGPLNGLLAGAWFRVGRVDRALPLYELAIADLETQSGISARERLEVFERGAMAAQRGGRRDLAERWAELGEALLSQVDPVLTASYADKLVTVRWGIAIEDRDIRRALTLAEAALPPDDVDRSDPTLHMRALYRLAVSATLFGELDRAEQAATESLAISRRVHGDDDIWTLRHISILAWVLTHAGKAEEALEHLIPVGPKWIELLGENHQDYAGHLAALGEAYRANGDRQAAVRHLVEAAEVYVRTAGPDSAQAGEALLEAGQVMLELGDGFGARSALGEVELRWQVSVAADAPIRIGLELARAEVELHLGDAGAAHAHASNARALAILHGDADALARAEALLHSPAPAQIPLATPH